MSLLRILSIDLPAIICYENSSASCARWAICSSLELIKLNSASRDTSHLCWTNAKLGIDVRSASIQFRLVEHLLRHIMGEHRFEQRGGGHERPRRRLTPPPTPPWLPRSLPPASPHTQESLIKHNRNKHTRNSDDRLCVPGVEKRGHASAPPLTTDRTAFSLAMHGLPLGARMIARPLPGHRTQSGMSQSTLFWLHRRHNQRGMLA